MNMSVNQIKSEGFNVPYYLTCLLGVVEGGKDKACHKTSQGPKLFTYEVFEKAFCK